MTQPKNLRGFDRDPIWDTPSYKKILMDAYDSPRCGGKFFMSQPHSFIVKGDFNDLEKVLLTSWLVEQRWKGDNSPKITEDVLSLVKGRKINNISVCDRADLILEFINLKLHKKLGAEFFYATRDPNEEINELVDNENNYFFKCQESRRENYYELHAISLSIDYQEVEFLLKYLENKKWIKIKKDVCSGYLVTERGECGEVLYRRSYTNSCLLTVEGHVRLEYFLKNKRNKILEMN